MEVIVKRLLIIMLILVAVGVASAGTIKFITDMKFGENDIVLLRRNLHLGNDWGYKEIDFHYNDDLREIYNLDMGTNYLYWVKIIGNPMINFGPCEINVKDINLDDYCGYYIIEKMFFHFPNDPDTPITQ